MGGVHEILREGLQLGRSGNHANCRCKSSAVIRSTSCTKIHLLFPNFQQSLYMNLRHPATCPTTRAIHACSKSDHGSSLAVFRPGLAKLEVLVGIRPPAILGIVHNT